MSKAVHNGMLSLSKHLKAGGYRILEGVANAETWPWRVRAHLHPAPSTVPQEPGAPSFTFSISTDMAREMWLG